MKGPLPVRVRLQELHKSFGPTEALRGVTTRFHAGELTGLVGPDGSGKTTLMRLMAGLMAPSRGRIDLDPPAGSSGLIGYMPQRFGLYEDLSIDENLNLYAALQGLPKETRQPIFDRLLTFTRLAPFRDRLAGQLSGGMKQKLGLACALIASPDLLLLDEPGVGVDPVSRQDLWRMVYHLTEQGVAVIWATAYLDEAERCDRVVLLDAGRVAFDGQPQQLTSTLVQRSFMLSGFEGDRRKLLGKALSLSSVCDGVIQGSALRLVLRSGADPSPLEELAKNHGGELQRVTPRFEDGYIDHLGGGPGGYSALAAQQPKVPKIGGAAVECRQLTKTFGRFTATDRVSFSVDHGEIFGLLGPNGAGKSTTFKMLCGLMRASSGEALVSGFNLRSAGSRAKGHLGYMAQKFSLYGLLSVAQNLEFSAGVYGLEGPQKRKKIAEMIDIFHLGPYLKSQPNDLPLGFKQRLALACAVMHEPSVLFLDEPTSGVDPLTRREFWTHINGLVQKGVTVLVTTHFMDEAEYCDRVALMYQAKLIALDTPDRLKAMTQKPEAPVPTMETAFIALIEAVDAGCPLSPPGAVS